MSDSSTILSCDLHAGFSALRHQLEEAVLRVLNSGWYILGKETKAFEEEFATFLGSTHAIGVASGTDGLNLALRACGLGPGDAAITVSHTAVATVAAIEMAGVLPVLVDVDPTTFTMDPQSVEDALANSGELRSRIKAIIPVHLYGHPVDMPAIQDIATRNNLRIIEDCSQSHGATLNGVTTGMFGDISVFSLYPTKNLGALGDAGIVTTNSNELAENLRLLRQYGWKSRNDSLVPGINSRLDEIQSAILRVKLAHLKTMNGTRQAIATRYGSQLQKSSVQLPVAARNVSHVYHQYVIKTTRRNELQSDLHKENIQTMIHYPLPVHRQKAYAHRLPLVVDLRNTDRLAEEILSLPIYPELSLTALDHVADALCRFRPLC